MIVDSRQITVPGAGETEVIEAVGDMVQVDQLRFAGDDDISLSPVLRDPQNKVEYPLREGGLYPFPRFSKLILSGTDEADGVTLSVLVYDASDDEEQEIPLVAQVPRIRQINTVPTERTGVNDEQQSAWNLSALLIQTNYTRNVRIRHGGFRFENSSFAATDTYDIRAVLKKFVDGPGSGFEEVEVIYEESGVTIDPGNAEFRSIVDMGLLDRLILGSEVDLEVQMSGTGSGTESIHGDFDYIYSPLGAVPLV